MRRRHGGHRRDRRRHQRRSAAAQRRLLAPAAGYEDMGGLDPAAAADIGVHRGTPAGRSRGADPGRTGARPDRRGRRPRAVLPRHPAHTGARPLADHGADRAGRWPSSFNERYGVTDAGVVHTWQLDPAGMTGRNQHGHTVVLRPFMGVMGMPPPEPGKHSTIPPRVHGGNLDCRELVAGSTLYLPIPVEDALFSVGDGHAAQGDGEVSGTAIECPMDRVELAFGLREDLELTAPQALTPAGWITFGLDDTLDDAAFMALDGMYALLGRLHGVSRPDAVALASVAVDLCVTQIVNQVVGVHAVLRPGAIR